MQFIKYVGLIILWVDVLVFVSALSVVNGGGGVGIPPQTNSTTTNDSNTVIEIKKNVTVITGSALETLTPLTANLTNTKEANRAKSRKVTQVDSFGGGGAVVADSKSELEKISVSNTQVSSSSTTKTTTTTPPPKLARVGLKVAENIYIDLAKPGTVQANNASSAPQTDNDKNKEGNDVKSTLLTTAKTTNITATAVANSSQTLDTDDNAQLNHTDKNNITGANDTATALNTTKTPTAATPGTNNSSSPSVISTEVESKSGNANTAKTNSSAYPIVSNNTNIITNIPSTTSSTTTTTTSSTTTTPSTTTSSTTTTTTPKPKKPTITYGVEDFPDLDKENPAWHNLTQQQQTSSSKSPMPEAPYAQPSQEEFNNNSFHGSRDYILPIVSMIFIIPLVIGVLITTYRRFRDCWSTRHYRRMDFLVDGMYND